ncbi:MAG: MFS transporter [Acidobacteriota bacterium]
MSRTPKPPSPAEGETSAGTHRRNLWAVSLTSFLTDISSEMILHLLPLYLSGVLGVKTNVIGLIEGVAEATSSLVKVFAGRLSDRLRARKGLAVAGYALSALAKPFFAVAGSWGSVAAVRWVERVGKGVRTAPRDALLADGAPRRGRGLAFGLHRAADTLGAVVGLGIALVVVWTVAGGGAPLGADLFRTLVLISLVPAFLGVAVLATLARDVPATQRMPRGPAAPASAAESPEAPAAGPRRGLGRRFFVFLAIVAIFDLGNSADAFLVLRAAERGLSVAAILGMLMTFNLIYALGSAPGGWLSDVLGRRRVLVVGWGLYAAVYLGLARAESGAQVWTLVAIYGLYHGLTHGTAKAMVADLVPAERRGAAYGAYHGTLGVIDLPASVLAGVLWHGAFGWGGFGAPAPFYAGAAFAGLAAALLLSPLGRSVVGDGPTPERRGDAPQRPAEP